MPGCTLKSMQTFLILDWECFSESPIKKAGAYEYSLHSSTKLLCAAFRLGTRESLKKAKTHLWFPEEASDSFAILLRALQDPSIGLVAHNALFEILITKYVFGPKYMPSKPAVQSIPLSRWHCTAAMARSIGLPGKLEEIGKAWNLKHQKDMEGHRLMLRMCKPKKPSKKDPSTRITDQKSMDRLGVYCVGDLDSEVELFLKLPELHPLEREFWLADQVMNVRGFAVDRQLVKGALSLIADETKRLDKRVFKLSGGKLNSARQVKQVRKFLKRQGINLPDLKAATVKEYLANEI